MGTCSLGLAKAGRHSQPYFWLHAVFSLRLYDPRDKNKHHLKFVLFVYILANILAVTVHSHPGALINTFK